jgi:hypothetical protein
MYNKCIMKDCSSLDSKIHSTVIILTFKNQMIKQTLGVKLYFYILL